MVHFEMKQTSILILTIIFAYKLSGQEIINPDSIKTYDLKNEIGINIASITNQTEYISSGINYNVKYNICNGILYKRHFCKNAIRVGFDFYDFKFKDDSSTNMNDASHYTYYIIEGHYFMGTVRLGYERILSMTKEQPFFAVDLSMSYGNGKNTSTGYYFSHSYEVQDFNITEIGIEPVIGVRYQFIQRLSLTIEINAKLYYVWTGSEVGHHSKLLFAFNPVRMFSFNFHF